MVIHSARPQAAGTTQNNPLKTNGPKNPDPSTPRQQHRILDLFASDCHVALEVTWSVYQNIIDAYRDPNKIRGKALMQAEINTLTSTRVPRGLTELITLGRTLKRRAGDTPGLLRPPPHQ